MNALGHAVAGALLAGAVCVAAAAQEVVQPLPNPASAELNQALRTLARNPNALLALIEAGRASLQLDDPDAAQGFFERARAVAPGDGRVLAGLALVAVRQMEPALALDFFEQARRAGEDIDQYAGDHGLAYDLVGMNAEAQERYTVALAQGGDAEIERRLALSFAIAGDGAASEATLLPLLQRRDVMAYRARAFALAIMGQEEQAVAIAEAMLPARLAQRMEPYLRHMRRLTPSQQAAAANLGIFPTAADIGRDRPQLARTISLPSGGISISTGEARLIPGGVPMGGQATASTAPQAASVASPASSPSETLPQSPQETAFAVTNAGTAAQGQLSPQATAGSVVPPAGQPPSATDLAPTFAVDASAPADSPPRTEIERPAGQGRPQTVSLAEAFAAFALPPEPVAVRPAPGAVDITAIEPAREVRTPPPPPPPPRHPSRIWVQVATGQDVAAFRFDWRRLVRQADGLLNGRKAYRARWGQTNRLLTGPFANSREADDFVRRLGEKGIDAFRFASAAGEEVVELN